MTALDFRIVIPSRLGSTRLPNKPLLDVAGKPLVVRCLESALRAGARDVVVATDDDRIAEVVRAAGGDVQLTRADHPSGTDRLAEVARLRGWPDDSIVVNLQGDEPLVPPALAAAPVVGYGLAWIGHFAFEKNRPASWHSAKHFAWSFRGDLRMWRLTVTGLMDAEVERIEDVYDLPPLAQAA